MLERIEKSFKCRMAYELSIEMEDSHWHLNERLFSSKEAHQGILDLITIEVNKSREATIMHYKKSYCEPILPPIWVLIEILSFGQCVKICKSLKKEYRNKISRSFGEDEKFIVNWMHCLSILRNACAHHSRLWNRDFIFTPKINHRKYYKCFAPNSRRLFNYLVLLEITLSKINPTSSWLEKLRVLIDEHRIEVSHMGFPENWEKYLNEDRIIFLN